MPASEETYRSQPRLHLVFALTSVGMMLSIVWMIAADHLRPWKPDLLEPAGPHFGGKQKFLHSLGNKHAADHQACLEIGY